MTAATEFAALRIHAPMQWLTLCCWAGGMTVRQTGVSLLIRDNTVVKHRMALRRKKLTPWTYDVERGTNMPGNTTEAPDAVQEGVQSSSPATLDRRPWRCLDCSDRFAKPNPKHRTVFVPR